MYAMTEIYIAAGEVLIDGTDDEVKIARALAKAADFIDKTETWDESKRGNAGERIVKQVEKAITSLAAHPSTPYAIWNPDAHPASGRALEAMIAILLSDDDTGMYSDKEKAEDALDAAVAYISGIVPPDERGQEYEELMRQVEEAKGVMRRNRPRS